MSRLSQSKGTRTEVPYTFTETHTHAYTHTQECTYTPLRKMTKSKFFFIAANLKRYTCLKIFLIILFYVYWSFAYMYVCSPSTCWWKTEKGICTASPGTAVTGGWLQAITWVLGIAPESFRKTDDALKHWTSQQLPSKFSNKSKCHVSSGKTSNSETFQRQIIVVNTESSLIVSEDSTVRPSLWHTGLSSGKMTWEYGKITEGVSQRRLWIKERDFFPYLGPVIWHGW